MSALFSWLGNLLRQISDVFGGFFFKVWEQTRKVFESSWAIVVLVAALAWEGFNLIGDLTIQAFQAIASIATGLNAGGDPCGAGLQSYLAIANTFYPLDETLRLMAALMIGVWLPLGIYRLIKSWLPTLAGGS